MSEDNLIKKGKKLSEQQQSEMETFYCQKICGRNVDDKRGSRDILLKKFAEDPNELNKIHCVFMQSGMLAGFGKQWSQKELVQNFHKHLLRSCQFSFQSTQIVKQLRKFKIDSSDKAEVLKLIKIHFEQTQIYFGFDYLRDNVIKNCVCRTACNTLAIQDLKVYLKECSVDEIHKITNKYQSNDISFDAAQCQLNNLYENVNIMETIQQQQSIQQDSKCSNTSDWNCSITTLVIDQTQPDDFEPMFCQK
ncbi:Hypothetical_protein [Hexamita inflata]|uniref:Hypothetical_protein n=1 Tax=Hexamita inflata TaxID=28002 RepID=A0AA86NTN5_9EUKA|nr:Hypothetical protein HINF_LOCUS12951 [Hexamita inflata]